MKFSNDHDRYVHGLTMEGTTLTGGDVAAPTGWFAAVDLDDLSPSAITHYGGEYVLLQESNEGFVTVVGFAEKDARDRRFNDLNLAWLMWLYDIEDQNLRDAIDGYTQAAMYAAGFENQGLHWSKQAQDRIFGDVTNFVLQNHDDLREWLTATGHEWLQVGIDFEFTRNHRAMTFAGRDGAMEKAQDATVRLVDTTLAWPSLTPFVNEDGELGVK